MVVRALVWCGGGQWSVWGHIGWRCTAGRSAQSALATSIRLYMYVRTYVCVNVQYTLACHTYYIHSKIVHLQWIIHWHMYQCTLVCVCVCVCVCVMVTQRTHLELHNPFTPTVCLQSLVHCHLRACVRTYVRTWIQDHSCSYLLVSVVSDWGFQRRVGYKGNGMINYDCVALAGEGGGASRKCVLDMSECCCHGYRQCSRPPRIIP